MGESDCCEWKKRVGAHFEENAWKSGTRIVSCFRVSVAPQFNFYFNSKAPREPKATEQRERSEPPLTSRGRVGGAKRQEKEGKKDCEAPLFSTNDHIGFVHRPHTLLAN